MRLSRKIVDLASLAKEIASGEEVTEEELRSGSRRRRVVRTRRVFCQVAVKNMGYSGAEVARFLGVTTSSVNRLAVSAELSESARERKTL